MCNCCMTAYHLIHYFDTRWSSMCSIHIWMNSSFYNAPLVLFIIAEFITYISLCGLGIAVKNDYTCIVVDYDETLYTHVCTGMCL